MSDIDDIRRRMAQIRRDAHYDVSHVVSEVEEAMEWRTIIRARPYIAIGVALAVGYLVVPRRRRPAERKAESVQPLLDASEAREFAPGRAEKPPKSLGRKAMGWAIGLVWPLIGQTVQAYAAMWLENQIKQHLNLNPRPENAPAPSERSDDAHGGSTVYRMPRRG